MNKKSRYLRKSFSQTQINELVEKYNETCKYKSLFSDKVFDSEYKWRNDIIRNLDIASCNKFFYLIEPTKHNCKFCKNILTHSEYSYGAKELGFKGFKTYCLTCEKNGIWRRRSRTVKERKNISDGLKLWSKTKIGMEFYKKRGIDNSDFMKKFSSTTIGKKIREDCKIKQSITMRNKIKDGTFTPNITNSWTHWTATAKIAGNVKKFRSSWEACFAICNPLLKYEFLRIPYGNGKTYIGDFYDVDNKILYEIKPRAVYNTQVEKISSAIQYCKLNNIRFIWINENNILKYIDSLKIKGYNRKQYDKMMCGLK